MFSISHYTRKIGERREALAPLRSHCFWPRCGAEKLLDPVRQHHKFSVGPVGIAGLQVYPEIMGTGHTRMHRKLQRDFGLLARFQCRRTDDRTRRSTAINQPHLGLAEDLQRLAAFVAHNEAGGDRLLDLHATEIYRLRLNHQSPAGPDTGSGPWPPRDKQRPTAIRISAPAAPSSRSDGRDDG